ncbi:MAG: rRNA pseudouridine synthase [Proteobacteria bacterium]|nr:rRNA pseudouridine synthase [Pseudomonadota bacterium]MBU1585503.1 rRNA pseudouridine synthase [Pseudomonadota bacterium]MBU2454664.1 rRNA pseudouridine synthase [Pseudomonadota bacterium]MBU2629272.1 rRNA pseudouridine synthase [Pseudomonadota bacterium]
MRLQKYLAHAGLCSRRKAEEFILNGRVKVNNRIITELGTKIDPATDRVLFDDQPVILKPESPNVYIAVNKPEGVVTSCSQQKTKIIIDLIDINERVYPVGRLDKDSRGLVLLTNDGELHNKLSHPSFNHEKEYIVTTVQPVLESALKQMAQGMMIDSVKTRKAKVKRLSNNTFSIVLKQGRNRQIRKMVGKTGNKVDTLTRIRMANITLGNLKEGAWRYLTPEEIKQLTQ